MGLSTEPGKSAGTGADSAFRAMAKAAPWTNSGRHIAAITGPWTPPLSPLLPKALTAPSSMMDSLLFLPLSQLAMPGAAPTWHVFQQSTHSLSGAGGQLLRFVASTAGSDLEQCLGLIRGLYAKKSKEK
uniref:Uncharacterized protein n=1 Tax=Molossus molossus TaxID=27622 RepID=A0A7J8I1A4_MOLMO|nr:hypothetical protein HJG59_010796 [Molossus molossus]